MSWIINTALACSLITLWSFVSVLMVSFFIAPKLTELDHYCIARGVSVVSPSIG